MHRMEWKIHHECRSDLKGEITMDFQKLIYNRVKWVAQHFPLRSSYVDSLKESHEFKLIIFDNGLIARSRCS